MATGGLMLLTGAMGLMAAQQASQNADNSAANAAGMDSVTTATLASTDIASTKGASTAPIQVDPALLRTGAADAVMSNFEKQFGIPRDSFARSLANGTSAGDILANAPSNPISPSDMAKATGAANNMSAAEKQAAMDNSGMSALQKDLGDAYAAGSGKSSSPSKSRSLASDDFGLGLEEAASASSLGGSPKVSSEIQNALAAQQAASEKKSYFDTSLFEVVHLKYREKTVMISGANMNKGIADAQGH